MLSPLLRVKASAMKNRPLDLMPKEIAEKAEAKRLMSQAGGGRGVTPQPTKNADHRTLRPETTLREAHDLKTKKPRFR